MKNMKDMTIEFMGDVYKLNSDISLFSGDVYRGKIVNDRGEVLYAYWKKEDVKNGMDGIFDICLF